MSNDRDREFSRRTALGALGFGTAAALAAGSAMAAKTKDKVTIYHVDGTRPLRPLIILLQIPR